VGDIILKVAQGDNEPLDIVGMRLDDAIEFIKGKKGTEVKLTIKKVDGTIGIISIIRDVVEIDETFAKTSIIEKGKRKFGLINLPKFYIDFSKKNFRNSATDMALEIERLKKENVEGLIIDLRYNGGGSLETAIDIAGLFIQEGPVVQVKYREGKPRVRFDKDAKIQWNKPLVVLVNELSASASEIFAAAMQDYNRAVIIGSNQTFGKGTVQQFMPLNNYYKYPKDLGALKMTIQKFYRVNGGSTQKEGVYSDIAIPSRYSYMKFGERDLDGALAWDKVPQAKYVPTNIYANFRDVVYNSKQRISKDPKYKLINDYAKWLKKNQDDTSYSLHYDRFVQEAKKREEQAKRFNSVFEYQSDLTFDSPLYEKSMLSTNPNLGDKRKAWHQSLAKDLYISEALNVLDELKLRTAVELVRK